MADGLTTQSGTLATVPASTKIATDEDSTAGHVQIVKLAVSTDGSATALTADNTDGLLVKVSNADDIGGGGGADTARIQVTPTISTSAYTAKDAVGGEMEFEDAASSSGGGVRIRGVELVDLAQTRAELELILFKETISATVTDNAAFDPTDADLALYVATIPISGGHYSDFNDNAVARVNCDVLVHPTATSVFGVLVARSTPTYGSTSDIKVALEVERL